MLLCLAYVRSAAGSIKTNSSLSRPQGIGGVPPEAYFEICTLADPHTIVSAIRHQVEQVHRSPHYKIDVLTDLLDRTLTEELIAQLSTFFGGLAGLLAATGLYGVLSYSVAQRTNEIGIRMALGAPGGSLLGMVIRETLLVVAMGTGLGVLLAVALARLAMLAGYVPARRAARVDLLIGLRHE